ncbi:GNAT family N-acetyltransferase [Corynebacterium lubricantis]|uniref:GNAT family N-acetyltransferase n=1 Tax=Corynebacterium lubricantis TaxID=541095 RepID=UPI000360504B|nr:GNAT family N-acetyltransferase [Corynebacterium lubricantis]
MNNRTINLISDDDPLWTELLTHVRHDLDHLPEYLGFRDKHAGTTTKMFVLQEGENLLLVPLVFTPLEPGFVDAASPQLQSSPVFSAESTPEWRNAAIEEMLEFLRDKGVVSLFLRTHALLDSVHEDFTPFGTVMEHNLTYAVPLQGSLDEIRSRMRKNHQRNIKSAKKKGLSVVQDTEWESLEEYHWIYSQTMERVGATDEFRFTKEYFEELRDVLGSHGSLWVIRIDGVLAGAHLVTEVDGTVQYLYGGSHPEYFRKFPQIALFDAVLEWAYERGNDYYFLGGGLQESLHHFKAGITDFHPRPGSVRIVVNPEVFNRHCAQWEATYGEKIEDHAGFFPPYRRTFDE